MAPLFSKSLIFAASLNIQPGHPTANRSLSSLIAMVGRHFQTSFRPDMTPGSLEIYEIYRMNVDGTDQQNLTNHPQPDDSFPAWPDDGYLIFSRFDCFLVLNPKDLSLAQIFAGSCTDTDSGHFSDWYRPQK